MQKRDAHFGGLLIRRVEGGITKWLDLKKKGFGMGGKGTS